MGQNISISTRHGRISAWQAKPHDKPRGALIVIQEIFGVNHHIRQVTDRFANYGYLAIAPALFDRISPGTELGYDAEGVARGRALAEELGFNGALDGVRGVYDLVEGEFRVGVVGYCWGGSVAYLANARIGLPAVSYYGGRTVPLLKERPKAPLMLHFGEDDPLIPAEDVAKHREALEDSAEIHVWPGAGHGFNCDQRPDYNEPVAKQALDRTLAFFQKNLR
ncbi:MAG TPA: dienelactone hydrolase family protein [Arenimonas sp.]|uniref:dienelactone hydrolase family protein n=1 Tax=Arenimonas sp. TaxID=1872635 RepID=UPI002D7F8BEC|nr:dienelactone hydrolase family protein [Arenimonas sp.]HEU0152632.1 dienelactone hydrolase family protein [Arenimonas sp.]